MYCRNCGQQIDDIAAVCVHCGVAVGNGANFCPHCGKQTAPGAVFCTSCGVALAQNAAAPGGNAQKSRLVAGLLGLFLGAFGVHNFYLGNTSRAVIQIVVSVITCGAGGIWGFIEGIMLLCGKIQTDAQGIPLKNDM